MRLMYNITSRLRTCAEKQPCLSPLQEVYAYVLLFACYWQLLVARTWLLLRTLRGWNVSTIRSPSAAICHGNHGNWTVSTASGLGQSASAANQQRMMICVSLLRLLIFLVFSHIHHALTRTYNIGDIFISEILTHIHFVCNATTYY